eukprot:snap_masked-scaffold_39-processed-gene-2.71-mRNA-1 protein AED:1.00 eAED:1.00 QI:0/0/0/0/1/1/2/0/80
MNILKCLRMKTPEVTVFSDNLSTVKLLKGQTISGRGHHIDVECFIKYFELKRNGLKFIYIEAGKNLMDISTKSKLMSTSK